MITSEASIAKFFVDHHEWKLALYAFCIGIIVVMPLLRRFRERLELKWIAVGFTLVWLTVFDYIEEYTAEKYFPAGDAPIALDLIDLVMWLGWIPFVVMIAKVMKSGAASDAAASSENSEGKA